MKVYMPLASSAKKPEKTTGFLQFHFDENHWTSKPIWAKMATKSFYTDCQNCQIYNGKDPGTRNESTTFIYEALDLYMYIHHNCISSYIYSTRFLTAINYSSNRYTYKLGAWCVGRTPVLSVTKVGGLGGGINGAVIKLENLHVKNVQISERVTVPPGVAILPQRLIRQVVVLQGTGLCNRHTISSSCK